MITSRAIAFCRIVKARTNEWEIWVKGTRENVMIRVAHSLPFDLANEAKEKINTIISSLEGRQYDPEIPQFPPSVITRETQTTNTTKSPPEPYEPTSPYSPLSE